MKQIFVWRLGLILIFLLGTIGCSSPTSPPIVRETLVPENTHPLPSPTSEIDPDLATGRPPTASPSQTPTPSPISGPLPTVPVTPPRTPLGQLAPYAPAEPLPPDFPDLAYTANGSVWILRYQENLLREEWLSGAGEWGLPLRMVLSPDGRFLALVTEHAMHGGSWLYIVGLDGSVRPLEKPGITHATVFYAWSSDATAVLASQGGYLPGFLSVEGTEFQEIAPGSGLSCISNGATISPDGRYVFCSGGYDLTRVDISAGLPGTVEKLELPRPRTGDRLRNLAWSPDGQQLAFTVDKMVEIRYGEGQLWLMDAAGTDFQSIGSPNVYDFAPTWSPDGQTIAFIRKENDPDDTAPIFDPTALVSSIWLLDIASGEEQLVLASEGEYAHWSPKWLPDGSGLVFISDRGGTPNIWLIQADGSGLQQLTKQGGVTGEIVLLP